MLELVKTDRNYSSAEVAKKLDIATATLRKYNSYFAKIGIHFKKEKGKLIYSEYDLEAFRMLMKIHETGGINLEQAVLKVAEQMKHMQPVSVVTEQVAEVVPTVAEPPQQPKQQEGLEEKLMKHMEEQEKQMKDMKEYIDTRLEERDKKMMDVIRQVQEIKSQKKKGFFSWLKGIFGKNE